MRNRRRGLILRASAAAICVLILASGTTPATASAPTLTASGPTYGAEYEVGETVNALGTVASPTGEYSMLVAIMDRETRRWWHADGSWGRWESHSPTISENPATPDAWAFDWVAQEPGSFGVLVIAKNGSHRRVQVWRRIDVAEPTLPEPLPEVPTPAPAPEPAPTEPPADPPAPAPTTTTTTTTTTTSTTTTTTSTTLPEPPPTTAAPTTAPPTTAPPTTAPPTTAPPTTAPPTTAPPTTAPAPPAQPNDRPGDTPFVRLWTEVNNPNDAKKVNELSGNALNERLDELTRWYVHFHSQSANNFALGNPSRGKSNSTLAAKLAEQGAMVSNYRNGSYVSQANAGQLNWGEAAMLEAGSPLAISTWWPGHKSTQVGASGDPGARLVSKIDPGTRTIAVTPTPGYRPNGTSSTWPYLTSRGTGSVEGNVTSASTRDFVSWVRVGSEIMRIRNIAEIGGAIALTVDRGYFDTSAQNHSAGSRVLSPVYIGSTAAASADTSLAGSPAVNRSDKTLRYGIRIGEPLGWSWIAQRINTTFSAGEPSPYMQGYNAVWLDVTSCATYNNSDSAGQPIAPFSDANGDVFSADEWGDQQLTKLAWLRTLFNGFIYPQVDWIANNLASQGAATSACRNRLLAEFDGGALEKWLNEPKLWEPQIEQSIEAQKKNLPALYWIKLYSLPSGMSAAQYKRFGYGSFLLTKHDSADRYQFGMKFGLDEPDPLFRWDLGPELSAPNSLSDIERVSCANTNGSGTTAVYLRRFENGSVLVNTSNVQVRCALAQPMRDITNAAQEAPAPAANVAIGTRDAAFLLN